MINQPDTIPTIFAVDGDKNTIPVASQIGITPGRASFTDGFPPLTMTPLGSGGVPFFGEDVNGLFNLVTHHLLFQSMGGKYRFDSTLCTALGGYDSGVVLQSDDGLNEYVNILPGNNINFNTTPASIGVWWMPFSGTDSKRPVGTLAMVANNVVPNGYLECDGSTVSRTAYATLFSDIGVTYGSGDGLTTFTLPDFRGYFLRGWSHGTTTDPDKATRTNRGDGTTGDNVGTKQASNFLAHLHQQYTSEGVSGSLPGVMIRDQEYDTDLLTYHSTTYGGNETRPNNIYLMFCIKY